MKKAKLKEQKKELKEEFNSFTFKKLIICLISISVALIGTYYLSDKYVKKNTKNTNPIVRTNERANNLIEVVDIKNIKEDNYQLLLFKENDQSNSTYDSYINTLKTNNIGDKFYYINIDDEANKSIQSKKTDIKDLNKIKVNQTTLIKVEKNRIKDKYVGSDSIISYLNTFFKEKETDK